MRWHMHLQKKILLFWGYFEWFVVFSHQVIPRRPFLHNIYIYFFIKLSTVRSYPGLQKRFHWFCSQRTNGRAWQGSFGEMERKCYSGLHSVRKYKVCLQQLFKKSVPQIEKQVFSSMQARRGGTVLVVPAARHTEALFKEILFFVLFCFNGGVIFFKIFILFFLFIHFTSHSLLPPSHLPRPLHTHTILFCFGFWGGL